MTNWSLFYIVRIGHGDQVTRARATLTTDLVLLAVALVWGSSYLAAKGVTAVTPVMVVLALRYAISAVTLVPLAMARRRLNRSEAWTGAVLGCTQAAVLTLETFGVAHTSATNAGLIISLTVIFTPLLSNACSRTWLPAPFFLAAALAVVGVGLLVSADGLRTPTWGDGLMLAAAGVRALHVTLIGELTRARQVDTVILTTVQAVVGALVLGAVSLPALTRHAEALSAGSWIRLTYLGLVCSVFAFLAQTWAVRRTPPSRASLLMGTEPVWAVAVGVGIAGEHLTLPAAAGAALIVVATFAGQRIEGGHSEKQKRERTGGLVRDEDADTEHAEVAGPSRSRQRESIIVSKPVELGAEAWAPSELRAAPLRGTSHRTPP